MLRPRTIRYFVLAMSVLLSPASTYGVVTYSVQTTMNFSFDGPAIDAGIINVVDFWTDDFTSGEMPDFPSFVTPEFEITGSAASRSMTAVAASTGAARYLSGPDPARAQGRTVAGGGFGLVNTSEFGFFVDVNVTAFFEFQASVDEGLSEYAYTNYGIQFVGNALEGMPDDGFIGAGIQEIREAGESVSGPLAYDAVSSSFILGYQEDFSILIPPSLRDLGGGVVEFEVYDLGAAAFAGGLGVSFYEDSSSFIVLDPNAIPDDFPPINFVDGDRILPEPGTLAMLVGCGLLVARRIRRR